MTNYQLGFGRKIERFCNWLAGWLAGVSLLLFYVTSFQLHIRTYSNTHTLTHTHSQSTLNRVRGAIYYLIKLSVGSNLWMSLNKIKMWSLLIRRRCRRRLKLLWRRMWIATIYCRQNRMTFNNDIISLFFFCFKLIRFLLPFRKTS